MARTELVVVTDRRVPDALIVATPGGDQMKLQAARSLLDVVNEDRGE